MPDFTVQLLGGDQPAWIDLARAVPEAPSRLVNDPDYLRSYRRIIPAGTVTIKAVVGGVVAPLDAALGGRLFTADWAEWSGAGPPLFVQAAGQSSLVTVDVTSANAGHFILRLTRDAGGSMLVPFDVEVVL